MSKDKLKRFAENESFHNLLQPTFEEVRKGFKLKHKWNKEFFKNDNPIVLELGCGKGEFTVGLAQKYTDKNFIGIDIKGARMWKGAKTSTEAEMGNVGFLRTRVEMIEDCFGTGEVDEIWITFPDPQPRDKTSRKRLTAPRFLNIYRNILKSNGLIHLKTDSRIIFDYTLEIIENNKHHIIAKSTDLYLSKDHFDAKEIQTFYEEKYLSDGVPINYLQFRLNQDNNA